MQGKSLDIPSDVKESARARVDIGYTVGIVIGLVTSKGTKYFSYGNTRVGRNQAPDQNTPFEIGSVTKVFTSTLLADMIQRGEVAMDDPIQQYLPVEVRVPERDGRQITFYDLATQTSGLPRDLDYSVGATNSGGNNQIKHMYDFISGYKLTRNIGSKFEYSNLGVGLLGHVLSLRAKKTYEELIRERISKPLGMVDTGITLSTDMKNRMAEGHQGGKKMPNLMNSSVLEAAGSLVSTAEDMVKFLSANMGISQSPLKEAMAQAHQERHEIGAYFDMANMKIGLGWLIRQSGEHNILWHTGTTWGYYSYIGFIKKLKTGVVVLTNSIHAIDDLALHILDRNIPLRTLQVPVEVDSELLRKYEGQYTLSEGLTVDLKVIRGRLTTQITNQERFSLLATSETKFFLTSPEADVTFELNETGLPKALTITQNGVRNRAAKVGDDYKPAPPKTEVSVDSKVLENYVGQYELMPGAIIDVKLQEVQLTVQLTGQPRFPVFAESETKFFLKVVCAQITFLTDKDGMVTSLILHQSGLDRPAKRIR